MERCPACLIARPKAGHLCVDRVVIDVSIPVLNVKRPTGRWTGRLAGRNGRARWSNFHRPDRRFRTRRQ